MVRSVALGFGLVTALAVAGSMTPRGQAMLGLSHPAAEQAAPVTVIQDKPAPVPAPVQSVAPMPMVPASGPAPAPSVRGPVPQPQARPAGPVAQRPPVGQGVPQQGGPGGFAGIANILLNLPQVLDQTHGGPARGSDSWSGSGDSRSDSRPVRFHKPHRGGDDHGQSDNNDSH